MPEASRLDRYLSTRLPGYVPGTLSPETVAFAAALDAVGRELPEIADAIVQELADQRRTLKLIASENFASPAVLLAMGNWLSDKYAEGSPGHRFYAGCDNVDAIESRAAELARTLFGAVHAYVQPHSGIDANLVAFWAVLTARVENPALERLGAKTVGELSAEDWETLRRALGDQKMMGMALDSGGHLTHGFRPNVSGKLFRYCSYGVDPETCRLDYDEVRRRAREERPLLIVAGYSSYPRRVDFRRFREIADEVGAVLMVDMAHFAGLVAGTRLHRRRGSRGPCAHRHHDHAQDALRGSARRARALRRVARRDRRPRLPARARRPAAARDGREGGGVARGRTTRLPRLRATHRRQRADARRGARRLAARRS